MNMPGFTAEASLFRSHERYQFPVNHVARADTRDIVPQVWFYFPPWDGRIFICLPPCRLELIYGKLVCVCD
jgi:hypothetical protein